MLFAELFCLFACVTDRRLNLADAGGDPVPAKNPWVACDDGSGNVLMATVMLAATLLFRCHHAESGAYYRNALFSGKISSANSTIRFTYPF
jgi:hypothetical protein